MYRLTIVHRHLRWLGNLRMVQMHEVRPACSCNHTCTQNITYEYITVNTRWSALHVIMVFVYHGSGYSTISGSVLLLHVHMHTPK